MQYQVFQEISDDFNYPSLNRKDLMSNLLQSQQDVTTITKSNWKTRTDRKFRSTSLFTGDINGAQSNVKGYKFTNKESFINKCDDIIDKKKLEIVRNSTFLGHKDMKGNKPQINKFRTQRSTNPIAPNYQLPSYETIDPVQPKFIKDPLEIDDINGARAKKDKWNNYVRNIDPYTEIDGSKPKIPKVYKNKTCNLQVGDITKKDWASKRHPNPLNPQYYGKIEEDKGPEEYGEIVGSKCAQLIPKNPKRDLDFNLKTQDIFGAQADFVLNNSLQLKTRKQFRQSNNTHDIPGCKPGTLQKQINTKRMTNPIRPVYQLPGHSENHEFENNQFTKSENENKIHTYLQTKSVQENNNPLPQIPPKQKQSQQLQNKERKQSSQRSQRSKTSHVGGSKPTVAQQLDSFIKKA